MIDTTNQNDLNRLYRWFTIFNKKQGIIDIDSVRNKFQLTESQYKDLQEVLTTDFQTSKKWQWESVVKDYIENMLYFDRGFLLNDWEESSSKNNGEKKSGYNPLSNMSRQLMPKTYERTKEIENRLMSADGYRGDVDIEKTVKTAARSTFSNLNILCAYVSALQLEWGAMFSRINGYNITGKGLKNLIVEWYRKVRDDLEKNPNQNNAVEETEPTENDKENTSTILSSIPNVPKGATQKITRSTVRLLRYSGEPKENKSYKNILSYLESFLQFMDNEFRSNENSNLVTIESLIDSTFSSAKRYAHLLSKYDLRGAMRASGEKFIDWYITQYIAIHGRKTNVKKTEDGDFEFSDNPDVEDKLYRAGIRQYDTFGDIISVKATVGHDNIIKLKLKLKLPRSSIQSDFYDGSYDDEPPESLSIEPGHIFKKTANTNVGAGSAENYTNTRDTRNKWYGFFLENYIEVLQKYIQRHDKIAFMPFVEELYSLVGEFETVVVGVDTKTSILSVDCQTNIAQLKDSDKGIKIKRIAEYLYVLELPMTRSDIYNQINTKSAFIYYINTLAQKLKNRNILRSVIVKTNDEINPPVKPATPKTETPPSTPETQAPTEETPDTPATKTEKEDVEDSLGL